MKKKEEVKEAKKDTTKQELDEILKIIGNQYASVVEDGVIADITDYIDTGCYTLNALISGDLFKGVPSNKIVAFAGEEATGKTFFVLSLVKNFLDTHKDSVCILFETEGSVTSKMMKERGLDTRRILNVPVDTVEQFKTQAVKIVDNYLNKPVKDRKKMLFVLDSLGMLSTTKEMSDTESGKDARDMTRAPSIKAAFRVLTLKLSKANIAMYLTNHVYDSMSMYSAKQISGGSGLKYSANYIITLSKSKEKDSEGNVVGAIIKCKAIKSRETRENTSVSTLLSHESGLDRYYGLVDLALDFGIFQKVGNKVKVNEETTLFESAINKNPEKIFTKDVLNSLNAKINENFIYRNKPISDDDGL